MSEKHNVRDKTHLFNLIGKRSNTTPNFAILIGSGASVSSGVKATCEMIDEWRHQLYKQSASADSYEKWLVKQEWYEDEEEYAILFEKVYDQRSQRRIYIEKCVENAKPSWGYIYLSNIVANNYFNVMFTPNFDDLLNEACFVYADCRPIVCAHDSAVVDIRVTSARPKIIKLHGDFLYDSIKNTIKETESLEKNMREKFMQFATEYGLVVIGYGGNDRSIMDILDTLARSGSYFPHGIYWCLRKGSRISRKLERLLRQDNVYLVEIEGFDEFMAELHDSLNLKLPDTVGDPYKATTEKLNRFILPTSEVKHPIIKKDIEELETQIKRFEKLVSGTPQQDRFVPYEFLGDRAFNRGNYRKASFYYEKESSQNPKLEIVRKLYDSYILAEKFKKAVATAENLIKISPESRISWLVLMGIAIGYHDHKAALTIYDEALKYEPNVSQRATILANMSDNLLDIGNWKEALAKAEEALQLEKEDVVAATNKSMALKKLNRKAEADELLKKTLRRATTPYHYACIYAQMKNKKEMLKNLKKAIKLNKEYRIRAKFDIDFEDYREDPEFGKIVYKRQRISKPDST